MIGNDYLAVFPKLGVVRHAPLFHCCFHVARVGAIGTIRNPTRTRISTPPTSLRCGIGTFFIPELARFLAGRSEEHTSDLPSLMRISYAVFCLKNTNTCT